MGLDMFILNKNKELCYWRKSNQIHKYFRDNILERYGEVVENFEEISIDKDLLKDLVTTCEKVLANPELAEKLLPTNGGCFFGSNEYDEDYFDDLKYTIKSINKIIHNEEYNDLYYCACW